MSQRKKQSVRRKRTRKGGNYSDPFFKKYLNFAVSSFLLFLFIVSTLVPRLATGSSPSSKQKWCPKNLYLVESYDRVRRLKSYPFFFERIISYEWHGKEVTNEQKNEWSRGLRSLSWFRKLILFFFWLKVFDLTYSKLHTLFWKKQDALGWKSLIVRTGRVSTAETFEEIDLTDITSW